MYIFIYIDQNTYLSLLGWRSGSWSSWCSVRHVAMNSMRVRASVADAADRGGRVPPWRPSRNVAVVGGKVSVTIISFSKMNLNGNWENFWKRLFTLTLKISQRKQ